jgi:hypothetical protein
MLVVVSTVIVTVYPRQSVHFCHLLHAKTRKRPRFSLRNATTTSKHRGTVAVYPRQYSLSTFVLRFTRKLENVHDSVSTMPLLLVSTVGPWQSIQDSLSTFVLRFTFRKRARFSTQYQK